MDERDVSMAIAQQLKAINDQAGAFIAGLLSDDLGEAEQIAFAHRLVDAAELIRQRATAPPIVVEGAVVHDHDDARTQLPAREE